MNMAARMRLRTQQHPSLALRDCGSTSAISAGPSPGSVGQLLAGKLMLRFQVTDSFAGTPPVSTATHAASLRAQSAKSQMTRPADITVRCSLPAPTPKMQVPDAVETAATSN